MATVTKYLQDCDFTAWCFGGEDFAVMNTNDRNLKGQFEGAGLNLTQNKITAIGIYGEYKRTTSFIYPMGNTNRGATLYNGTSILTIGSAVSSQEDGDSKMSNSYASFTNYYTTDANIINSLVNQINSGLVVTIDLHADNKGGNSQFHLYGKNIRLVVTYEEKPKYTISLSAGAGGKVDTAGGTYYSGEVFYVTATPNAGYTFSGWNDGSTNNPRKITVAKNLSLVANFAPIPCVSYDTILSYQKWKNSGIIAGDGVISNITDIGFTLTSNAGVGEATASSPYFPVEPGKSYKIDIDFSGTNWDVYIFFCDADGRWVDFADGPTNRFSHDGSTGVSKDNAIFTAPNKSNVVKACIRVDSNGANNTVSFSNFRIYPADYRYMSNTVSATERTDAASWSMPTPTREGYTFKGWNTKPDGSGTTYTSSSTFPSSDLILYSQWAIKTFKVTFKDENGATLKTETVNYGSTATAPTDPVKADTAQHKYTFDGWYDANGNKWYPNTAIGSDTTYTARFTSTVQRYTVKWYNEDGSVLLETDELVPYGTMPEYNGETPTKAETVSETYEHIGWSIDVNSSGTTELTAVIESVNYYARFRAINKTYTVVWKNDDGTVLETDTAVPYGDIPDYNGAVPTKDDEQYDYTFLGWSANVEDTPLDDIQLPTVTGNITYTAVYTKTPKHFMVFVDLLSDKGEMLGGYMKIVEYGRETGIDAEEIEGYRFVKWSDGNTDNPRNITVTAEVTYQAIYERIPIPIIVNEEQPVTGVYIVPTTQTIVYVVSGEVPTVVADGITVDDWSFKVSNTVPEDSYLVEKLYINETRVY